MPRVAAGDTGPADGQADAARAGSPVGEPLSLGEVRRLLDGPEQAAAWAAAAGLQDPAAAHRFLRVVAGSVPLDLVGSLAGRLAVLLPGLVEPDRSLRELERYLAGVRSPLSAVALFDRDPRSLGILLSILDASPFLASIVAGDPEAWEAVRLDEGRPVDRDWLVAEARSLARVAGDPETAMQSIRRLKRREILRIAYGDIVRGQSLETVTRELSHLADAILAMALDVAGDRLTAQWGRPRDEWGREATFVAIALGKLGGRELNYSSDIDLVFVYSAEGRTDGARTCTNHEFFERLVREVVRLVSETTSLGRAFRVDLRLRPLGEAGPAALSLDATLAHFDQHGRTWQRQAWLKARPAAGDEALGLRLLEGLSPWLHHRWLSRADISGIKALKRRIERLSVEQGTDDRDVKNGRGGIRDIEYAIQFLQLLAAGDPRGESTGNTLEAIRRLASAGSLTDQERSALEANYTLLRTVEHRLQLLFDRRTHVMPRDDEERRRLAARAGFGGPDGLAAFDASVAEATALDRTILDHLLHDAFPDSEVPEPEVDLVLDPAPADEAVDRCLAPHGFRDPAAAFRNLQSLAEEKVRFLSTRRCRHFLAGIAPRLLRAIAATPDPDATLVSLARVSESLGGKGVLWELFSFHPPSLDLYVKLCASSPLLAGILVGHPGMIDELLDSLVLVRLPTAEELDATLRELCRGATEIPPILAAFKASQQLRVGVRDILGREDVTATTATLTAIAEAVVRRLVAGEEMRLMERLGEPMAGGGESVGLRAGAVVLAMGKFGGREMNYHSDVDVVFLYDHDGMTFHPRRSRRSTESTTNAHFFAELARSVMRQSNAFSPAGRLYEMDSRLRPGGRSGPPALSIDALAAHFAPGGPAAIWERQALVKARVVVGEPAAAARATEIVTAACYGRPWSTADMAEIRRMRYRLEEGAARENLKRGPGGVVDIEFIVQALQLLHGGRDPTLRATETLAGLTAIHAAGIVSDRRRECLETAYRVLRAIEGRLRLLDAAARHEFPRSREEQDRLAHLLAYERTDELITDVRELTARTRAEFEAVFDEITAGGPA